MLLMGYGQCNLESTEQSVKVMEYLYRFVDLIKCVV